MVDNVINAMRGIYGPQKLTKISDYGKRYQNYCAKLPVPIRPFKRDFNSFVREAGYYENHSGLLWYWSK
jgi:hypothetical protein